MQIARNCINYLASISKPTNDDGYILVGRTSFSGVLGDTHYDWMIKTDSKGREIWNRSFDVTNLYLNGKCPLNPGCRYVTRKSDGACLELNSRSQIESIHPTPDDSYILAGQMSYGGARWDDAWLIKVDSEGHEIWNRTFGGTGEDWFDLIQSTSDSGYILEGHTRFTGDGRWNTWLIKVDSDGNEMWNCTIGGANDNWANSVQVAPDGGYLLVGLTNEFSEWSGDARLTKVDPDGRVVYNSTFGGRKGDSASSVQPTSDGGCILAGQTTSFGAGGADAWLVKIDSAGNELWNKTFGGKSEDYAYSILPSPDGGHILAGSTSSFGAGGSDAWLIKVAPG